MRVAAVTWPEVWKRAARLSKRVHGLLDVKILLALIAGLIAAETYLSLRSDRLLAQQIRSIDARLGAMPPAVQAAFEQALDPRLMTLPPAIEAAIVQAHATISTKPAADPDAGIKHDATPIQTTCDYAGCTGTLYVEGVCDGTDQIWIRQRAWEKRDILITRASIDLLIRGPNPLGGYAQIGNSVHPDIMAQQTGTGSHSEPLDPPFEFPARVDEFTHIDIHVGCEAGNTYQAWGKVFYRLS